MQHHLDSLQHRIASTVREVARTASAVYRYKGRQLAVPSQWEIRVKAKARVVDLDLLKVRDRRRSSLTVPQGKVFARFQEPLQVVLQETTDDLDA